MSDLIRISLPCSTHLDPRKCACADLNEKVVSGSRLLHGHFYVPTIVKHPDEILSLLVNKLNDVKEIHEVCWFFNYITNNIFNKNSACWVYSCGK